MMRAVTLALALALVPATAKAQEGTVDTYTAARERYAEGAFDEALALFRQVLAETESPNARLYVARCLSKQGELVQAYDEMARTVRDASAKAKSEARFAATRDAAIRELEAIQAQVGRVTVELKGDADDVTVTLNGEPLTAEQLGVAKGVTPGDVEVVASSRARGNVRKQLRVAIGANETVTLELPKAPDATGPVEPQPAPEVDAGVSPLVIGGAVALGVGVAGMVAFGVTGSMAKSKFGELESNCGEGPCSDPSFDAIVDDGERLQTIANAMLGVGAVGLAAGTALVLVGVLNDDDAVANSGVYVAPALHGGFAGYRARF